MAYTPSQHDFDMLLLRNKRLFYRIELLDKSLRAIDDLSGEAVSCSYSIDSESSIRRTMSVSLVVTESSMDISDEARSWYDRFFRIYVGYVDLNDNTIWYLMGTFVLSEGQYDWDATTSILSLSCIDLGGWLDGTRNGYVRGLITKIPEGASIRGSLIKLITQEAGLSRYRIDVWQRATAHADGANIAEFDVVPYDMEFGIETSVWEKISQLAELYPGWEAFFDIDGTFVFQEIPTLEEDDCILDDQYMQPLMIGEPTLIPYTDIYNVADVYGACNEADYSFSANKKVGDAYVFYPEEVELSKTFDPSDLSINTKLQIKPSVNLLSTDKIAFSAQNDGSQEGPHLNVYDENGNLLADNTMKAGKLYVVKYRYDRNDENKKVNERFLFLGEPQVHAVCKEIGFRITEEQKAYDRDEYEACDTISYIYNPDSPFAITEMWSETHKNDIRQPLSGGEYENIYSSELALERAEYEVWKSTRFQEQTEFNMIAVPFLDVNQKIEYTSFRTHEKKQYIIKNISGDLMTGTMSVTAIKFYPLYPFVLT